MRQRIQWVFACLTVVMAAVVILEAQLWVSTANGITTSGTVATTNSGSAALAVTGGADVGGVIQAGSSNINLTNAAGNLLPAALAAGTISTSQTFTAPITLQASTAHIFTAPSGLTLAQWRGRVSDDAGSLQFVNNAGTTEQARLTWTNTPALTISGGAGGTTGIIVGNTAVSWAGVRLNSSPAQPGFLAFNSSGDSYITVATHVLDFDTEVYDTASSFASDTFTAPVTGIYHLCVSASGDSTLGTNTVQIATSNRSYSLGSIDVDGSARQSTCVYADMDVSDTAAVTVITVDTGGGVSTSISGSGSPYVTYFSGRLQP